MATDMAPSPYPLKRTSWEQGLPRWKRCLRWEVKYHPRLPPLILRKEQAEGTYVWATAKCHSVKWHKLQIHSKSTQLLHFPRSLRGRTYPPDIYGLSNSSLFLAQLGGKHLGILQGPCSSFPAELRDFIYSCQLGWPHHITTGQESVCWHLVMSQVGMGVLGLWPSHWSISTVDTNGRYSLRVRTATCLEGACPLSPTQAAFLSLCLTEIPLTESLHPTQAIRQRPSCCNPKGVISPLTKQKGFLPLLPATLWGSSWKLARMQGPWGQGLLLYELLNS